MSILIFAEVVDGEVRGTSLEAVAYGATLAKMQGTEASALVLGTSLDNEALTQLGNYGVSKVINIADERLNQGVIQAYSSAIGQAVESASASTVIFAKSSLSDAVAARLAIKMKAGLASNVAELPVLDNGFVVKRAVYTGKAFQNTAIKADNKILTLKKGAISAEKTDNTATVETFEANLSEADFGVKITNTEKVTGQVLLPEADLVVSAGRGLKGPENWGMIEELAQVMGAATGCSKPVSDLDWRPHHEHVGQTGVKVAPNLYIAVGISGAIQHLAGVSSSKVIVVINKDADAPFFKAADYGIVGDAFEVVPKLVEAFKNA